jgi:outer membrane protein TolC
MWKLLVLILCLAGFDYTPPELLAKAPALPDGYDAAQAMQLDLPGVLALAVRQNLGITLAREEVRSADLDASSAAWVLYEPEMTASYSPREGTWSAGVSSTLPTGARIGIDGSASTVRFSFVQPLLRGFSPDLDIPRTTILTAKIASEQQRQQLAIAGAALVRETEAAYWDVVYSLYAYNVAVGSRQLAHDTVDLVRRQIAAGIVAPSDLTGAQNTYASREIEVLRAAQGVERSWDALRTILNLPRDQWRRPLLPTDKPAFAQRRDISVDDAYATALKKRPERITGKLALDAADIAVRKAKNDELPQLDVGVTTSFSDPNRISDDFAGWSVMGTVTWSPFGRGSKLATRKARIARHAQELQNEQQTQAIYNEVRSAVRDRTAAALEVVAASESRKLAAESLAIETQKYLAGDSSNLNLAQLQSGLASAELTELSALIAHEKAEVAVLLATGQLLDARHISLAEVR